MLWSKHKRSNAKLAKYAAPGLALFGLFCFIRVWQNVTVEELHRKNGELRRNLKEIRQECARLTARVEEVKRLDRIYDIAVKEFNYIQAPKINLFLKDER